MLSNGLISTPRTIIRTVVVSHTWFANDCSVMTPNQSFAIVEAHFIHFFAPLFGEVQEWLNWHAWKACIPQGIEGSNPSLSAVRREDFCHEGTRTRRKAQNFFWRL